MRALLLGGSLGFALACSGPPSCPNDLPASCPSNSAGYAATIGPLVEKRCLECHGKATNPPDLTSYAAVSAQKSAVLNQVYGCLMPPPDAGQLTTDEREQLLGWLKCGAMNN